MTTLVVGERVWWAGTHLFQKLIENKDNNVERWFNRKGVNIFKSEVLLLPMRILKNHWVLMEIRLPKCEMSLYDSFTNASNSALRAKHFNVSHVICNVHPFTRN